MSVPTGCQCALRYRGTIRQCAKLVVITLTVSKSEGERHRIALCQQHYQQLTDNAEVSEYIVDNSGTPLAMRVKRV